MNKKMSKRMNKKWTRKRTRKRTKKWKIWHICFSIFRSFFGRNEVTTPSFNFNIFWPSPSLYSYSSLCVSLQLITFSYTLPRNYQNDLRHTSKSWLVAPPLKVPNLKSGLLSMSSTLLYLKVRSVRKW